MSASVYFDSSTLVWKQPKFLRWVQEEAAWLSKCAGPSVSVKLSPVGCTSCDHHFVATFAYEGAVFGAVTYRDHIEEEVCVAGTALPVPGSRAWEAWDSVPAERVRGWLERFLQSAFQQRLAHLSQKLRDFDNLTAARREAGAP